VNSLFEATDYRAWIKHRTEEIKAEKPHFSYRFIGTRLGVNAGYLTRVLNGQAHFAPKLIPVVAQIYGLNEKEERYLDALVRFNRSRSENDSNKWFLQMQALRGLGHKLVADEQFEFYARWRHTAMRVLLSLLDFEGTDFRKLGSRFVSAMNASDARESVQLLETLGLIEKDSAGIFRASDAHISTGEKWQNKAITECQKEMIRLSASMLDDLPRSARDISSITFPFARQHMDLLRERIQEFRQEILSMTKDMDDQDTVYQLNLQLFPLAYADTVRAK